MNVKVSEEQLLMAEGLHPKDVAWLEQRVETLEAALEEIASKRPCQEGCPVDIARVALSEGDAFGG